MSEGYTGHMPELQDEQPADVFSEQDRQRLLAANFIERIAPYIDGSGKDSLTLRPHQSPALEELRDFFVETADTPDRRILWPAPPNFGKSTMAPLVIRAAGIGEVPAAGGKALKSLVLVPREVARQQIIDSCAAIAPDVRATSYLPKQSARAIDNVDLMIMTYKGCVDLAEHKWQYISSRIDLLVLDEVHRGLGLNIADRLNSMMENERPTILALSATPNFDQNRTAANILGIDRTITPMTPREAAQTGVSNGVQLIALHSGAELHVASHRRTISEHDVHPLIQNQPRNTLITEVIRDMAGLARQGLVHCLPGGSNRHAEMIAEQASDMRFVDPRTGKERNMLVEAVGTHKKQENADIIARFKAGELDALTFSKYLIEAFDYNGVRYVLAASPTASAVDMGQLVGRGARLGDGRITKLFCLLDNYQSRHLKYVQTPFQVYGAESFTQGEVIRPPSEEASDYQPTTRERDKNRVFAPTQASNPPAYEHPMYEGLTPRVLAAVSALPPGTILDEMLISKEVLTKAPEGYVLLGELPFIREGRATKNAAAYALRDRVGRDGRPMAVNVQESRLYTYVSPEAVVYLHERLDAGNDFSRLEITNFLVSQGWPRMSFDSFAAEALAARAEYSIVKKTVFMKPENTFNLLAHLAETPLVNPDEEVHVSELARTLGNIGCSDLHRLIKNEPKFTQYFRFRRRGRQPGAFQSVGTLATEGAVKLAEMAIGRSKKINWSVKDAPGVVAAAQYEYRQYLWQHKLRTTLATTAIHAFVTRQEDLLDLSEPAITAEPAEPPARAKARQLSADGAASARSQLWRLDPSYRLSGRGTRWAEAAACISMDADLFDHPQGDVLKTVQDACKGCAVKGDCLLFHIEVPTDGFRAGFSKKMRDRMTTPEIVDWLRSSKPSTPQKSRNPAPGTTKPGARLQAQALPEPRR